MIMKIVNNAAALFINLYRLIHIPTYDICIPNGVICKDLFTNRKFLEWQVSQIKHCYHVFLRAYTKNLGSKMYHLTTIIG